MNFKTLSFLLMLCISLNVFADDESEQTEESAEVLQGGNPGGTRSGTGAVGVGDAAAQAEQQARNTMTQYLAAENMSPAARCPQIEAMTNPGGPLAGKPEAPGQKKALAECKILRDLGGGQLAAAGKDNTIKSSDGKISCKDRGSWTVDYEPCEKAIKFYSAVMMAEQAMLVEQKVRTDLKGQSIAKKTAEEMKKGASQTAAFDAAEANHNHMQGIQKEKLIAYGAAGVALFNAQRQLPTYKKTKEDYCGKATGDAKTYCEETFRKYKGQIIANDEAKSALLASAMDAAAKAAAAGLSMSEYQKAGADVAAARNMIGEDGGDMMMEKCVLNPTDPSCAKNRDRVAGESISMGDFGSGVGESNSFNLAGESEVTPEMGAETNLDENAPVAGVNTPFADDAKIAKGILDPAAAAQMQATGGAAGGGGGGGGGGLGGGGASLGSDLNGANKDGDKEAQIKTGKVSGAYSQGGGGGYKGVGKSKDDANPFSSLFDAKGSGGGVEEDRSIASGDIDGASSGLFQKISKRYGQVQADKRLEAKNLE